MVRKFYTYSLAITPFSTTEQAQGRVRIPFARSIDRLHPLVPVSIADSASGWESILIVAIPSIGGTALHKRKEDIVPVDRSSERIYELDTAQTKNSVIDGNSPLLATKDFCRRLSSIRMGKIQESI